MLPQHVLSQHRGRAKMSAITTEAAPSKAWVGTRQRPEFTGWEPRAGIAKVR